MLRPEARTSKQNRKRADQIGAKAAAADADWGEQDAADALGYAVYVVMTRSWRCSTRWTRVRPEGCVGNAGFF
jgi:hypothetical protein